MNNTTNEPKPTTTEIINPLLDEKEYLKALDQESGWKGQIENLPLIKFSALDGNFVINRGEKDEENKYVFSLIGPELSVHILNTAYNLVNSGVNAPLKVYSQEYSGNNLTLFNQETREVEATGDYKTLKVKYDLKYTKVLYAVYNEELVRVKLSGFSLSNFFKFLQKNGNPLKYITKFCPGRRMKGLVGVDCVEATKKEIETYKNDLATGKKPTLNLFYEYTPIVEKEMYKNYEGRQLTMKRFEAFKIYVTMRQMGSISVMPKEFETTLIPLGEEIPELPKGDVSPFLNHSVRL